VALFAGFRAGERGADAVFVFAFELGHSETQFRSLQSNGGYDDHSQSENEYGSDNQGYFRNFFHSSISLVL
jgi:hypothetical protein